MAESVELKCPSAHWGFAENASGSLRVRCSGKRCRLSNNGRVIHKFDLASGSFSTSVDTGPNHDSLKDPADDQ